MKLIDLLKSLGTKGKIDLNKPENKAVLEAAKDIDVPQEFADQLETALMSEDAAVSNKAVRARLHHEILGGEDAFLNGIITDLQIDDSVKEELKKETDTRKKIRTTLSTLTQKQKAAKKDGDNVAEETYKRDIAELRSQLKKLNEDHAKELQKEKTERENDYVSYEIKSLLGAKQYALPENMPTQQKIKTAMLIVNDELAQKNLKVVKSETGQIKLLKADGTDPYDDKHSLLELPSFLDGALAKNGLLKNSDPTQGNPSSQHSFNQSQSHGPNGNAPVVDQRFMSELSSTIADLTK